MNNRMLILLRRNPSPLLLSQSGQWNCRVRVRTPVSGHLDGNHRGCTHNGVMTMESTKVIRFKAELCEGCLACEVACSKVLHKNEEGGEYSAIRIIKQDDEYEMTNCDQCGLCIDMCGPMALSRNNMGVVILDDGSCVGCQNCVSFCPTETMRRLEGKLIPFKCISCGACVRACPTGALTLEEVQISEVNREVYAIQGVDE